MGKKTMSICIRSVCTAMLAAAIAGLCACSGEPQTRTVFALDTLCSITLYAPADGRLAQSSADLLLDEEQRLSAHLEQSEVSLINRAGGKPVTVSRETAELVALGVSYARATDGLFDIAIGRLSSLWDFHDGNNALPDPEALRAATAYVDARGVRVEMRDGGGTVQLASPQMQLDLGGIAKGWISDAMADDLRAQGVKSAIINLGGNVVTVGSRPDGKPFAVGIQAPFAQRNELIGTLKVRDAAVVTAGIYERSFELDGVRYHHILDPRTGYPVASDLIAATIVCERAADGDALSTSCLLLGEEKAKAMLEREGRQAVLIRQDGTLYVTEGLREIFTPVEM